MHVPELRVTPCNRAPARPGADYMLYWMSAHRRLRDNFALDRAVQRANEFGVALLIFEPLRCDLPWSSERSHRFILDGMADHAAALSEGRAGYLPYVETRPGECDQLLAALATHAVLIVADEFPCRPSSHVVAEAARRAPVFMEQVDANGLLPLRAAPKTYTVAHSFRRGLHKLLPDHLTQLPERDPLGQLRAAFTWTPALKRHQARWPQAAPALLQKGASAPLQTLPIDHAVPAVAADGGPQAGLERLEAFLDGPLDAYARDRNKPALEATSNLSAFLRSGHVGAHTIFRRLAAHQDWSHEALATKPTGKREGWWHMSPGAEAFMEELVTWRELGYNMSFREPDTYDDFSALPDWAKRTLAEHADDEREHVYSLAQFERARTHDALWNATQTQLAREGRIHGYLRMLWGKKILHWTRTPYDALEVMLQLNNRHALDGRGPSAYAGIFWVLGRYDRAWTERRIFGKVRFMTSQSTRRKHDVKGYLATYAPERSP